MSSLTKREAEQAVEHFGSQRKAAQGLGVTLGMLQRRLKGATAVAAPALSSKDEVAQQDELRRMRRELRDAYRADITAEKVRTEIMGLAAAADPELPAWVLDPKRRPGSSPGVPVTQWSDWHLQEVVRKAETGGLNEYSMEIARERVERLVRGVIYLSKEHMVNPVYPGIVVCLGGDMITGEIHAELAETNDLTTPQGILYAYELALPALRTVADNFGQVLVVCVAGNHARDTMKPRVKRYTHRNFDWLLYCLLERALKDDPRFVFIVPEGTDALFRVYNHRFLATHGDNLGVKGGDGIIGSIGPIMRGRLKVHTAEAQIGRDFDTLLLHHWHQELFLPGCIVNNALIGYNEFAKTRLRARYAPASQNLFFVHYKHGITCTWPVRLQDRAADKSAPWTSWRT